MSLEIIRKRRRVNFDALKKIYSGLKKLQQKTLLDDEDLSNFNIRASRFDLKGDGKWSDGTSGFFAPLTHEALPTLPDVDMEGLEYTESPDPYHIGRQTDGNIRAFLSGLQGEGRLQDHFRWGIGG